MEKDIVSRYRGALLGLAVGDALGVQVEFMRRDTFPPVIGMAGGGPHNLRPGQWTDDTSMALCLAESFIENCGKINEPAIMDKWLLWWKKGHLSSTGKCFDIGTQTAQSLGMFSATRKLVPYRHPNSAGNGSLMRLAPAVMVRGCERSAMSAARAQSQLTHDHPDCLLACDLFAAYLWRALWLDGDKVSVLAPPRVAIDRDSSLMPVACGSFRYLDRDEVCSTGYVVHTLEAALWAFWHGNDYASTVLLAANLGDDSDTVAAVAGQLAGAFYGVDAIPGDWLHVLAKRNKIQSMADRLYEIAAKNF